MNFMLINLKFDGQISETIKRELKEIENTNNLSQLTAAKCAHTERIYLRHSVSKLHQNLRNRCLQSKLTTQ